jgi:hypothetical protein
VTDHLLQVFKFGQQKGALHSHRHIQDLSMQEQHLHSQAEHNETMISNTRSRVQQHAGTHVLGWHWHWCWQQGHKNQTCTAHLVDVVCLDATNRGARCIYQRLHIGQLRLNLACKQCRI